MLNDIDEILIHEEQRFDLDIRLENSKYYSASININQQNATLEIFGEVEDDEKIISYKHFMGENIYYLEGINSKYKFHFYDLNVFYFVQRSIHSNTKRNAFHIKLIIKYFHLSIAHQSSHYKSNIYSSLTIYSPTITKWLGITEKQLEIFNNSSKSRLPSKDFDLLCEFSMELENSFNLNILYNAVWKRNYNSHKTISEFPPYLNVNFRSIFPDFTQIKQIISEIISLFYALTGKPVLIEKAFLCFPGHTKKVPFYLSGSNLHGKDVKNKDMLLCYSSDHLFNKEKEPAFPIETFHNYFCLENWKKDVFRKFYIYDTIHNKEERFIGLFRIVEKLSYIQSVYVEKEVLRNGLETMRGELINKGVKAKTANKLIERFFQVNNQKINAESAIFQFLRSLEKETYNDIKHLEKEIQKIITLRNAITHCKPYTLVENEIERYILVLNYICILLLWREIGLSKHKAFKTLHYLYGYRNLEKKE